MPKENLSLKAALTYAGRGWKVFPCHTMEGDRCSCTRLACREPGCQDSAHCHRPAKHPRTREGLKEATTDGGVLHRWFESTWPNSNVAIATGEESGIVVIDVDGPEGAESLHEWEQENGKLPHTIEQITGSGGRQVFFAHPGEPVKTDSHLFGKGSRVDVRGNGGYVIVPPSIHFDGPRYEWESSSHPSQVRLAPLPAPLLAHLRSRRDDKAPVALPDIIHDGEGRESALVSRAGSLRRIGMSESEIYAALSAFNEARVSPPKSDEDIRRISRSIARKAPDPDEMWRERQRARLAPSSPAVVAEDDLLPATPSAPPKNLDLPQGLIETYAAWAARADDAPSALIPGILHCGSLAFMAATPKAGKTWLATDIILSVISGTSALAHYPVETTGRVLYVATEGIHADSRDRVKALALGKGMSGDDIDGFDIIWRRGVLLDDPIFGAFLRERATQYVLIVIDVLADAWIGDEDRAREVRPLLHGVRAISDLGPTCLLLHHYVKPTGENANRRAAFNMRGSTAFYGAMDDGIFLADTSSKNRSVVTLETRAGRPSDGFEFSWPDHQVDGSRPESLAWHPLSTGAHELAAIQSRVLAAVGADPGIGETALRNRLRGVAHDQLSAALAAMAATGSLDRRDVDRFGEAGKRLVPRPGYFLREREIGV